MRAILAVTATALFAFSLTTHSTTAEAGLRKYMICWMTPTGVADCAWLSDDYQLSWARKPYCNRVDKCKKGTVSFTLTHDRIACLRRWVGDTSSMFPTHTATIYAPKAR